MAAATRGKTRPCMSRRAAATALSAWETSTAQTTTPAPPRPWPREPRQDACVGSWCRGRCGCCRRCRRVGLAAAPARQRHARARAQRGGAPLSCLQSFTGFPPLGAANASLRHVFSSLPPAAEGLCGAGQAGAAGAAQGGGGPGARLLHSTAVPVGCCCWVGRRSGLGAAGDQACWDCRGAAAGCGRGAGCGADLRRDAACQEGAARRCQRSRQRRVPRICVERSGLPCISPPALPAIPPRP